MAHTTSWWSICRQTVSEFNRDNCSRMSAAIAYYAAFSIAPLLILVLTICGLIWDPADVKGQLEVEMVRFLGDEGTAQIRTMLAASDTNLHRNAASLFSLTALVFGALGVVSQLQAALNDAWDVAPDPNQGGVRQFLVKRLISAAMILAIALLLLISLILSTLVSLAGDQLAVWLPGAVSGSVLTFVSNGLSLILMTLLFSSMFRILPDAQIDWSDVWFGGFVTSLLFLGGKYLFGLYLSTSQIASAYGAPGSMALLLLWLYYSAAVLLLGAEFTQVWSQRHGRRVLPEQGAKKKQAA